MHYFQSSKARATRPHGLSGLSAVNMANLADWAKGINFPSARAYNLKSSRDNNWTIHPGVGIDPGSDDFVMYVAAFQHGANLAVDGKLGPQTLAKAKSGIDVPFDHGNLAKTVVTGGIDVAAATRYNEQSSVGRGWKVIPGKAYSSAGDPKLAQDVASVQRAHNIRVTGTMDDPTRALFISLINQCERPGQLIADSLQFPGASCGTPLQKEEPAKPKTCPKGQVVIMGVCKQPPPEVTKCPEGQALVNGVCTRKKLVTKQKPVAESNTGMVVGLLAAAAGAYYLTQS